MMSFNNIVEMFRYDSSQQPFMEEAMRLEKAEEFMSEIEARIEALQTRLAKHASHDQQTHGGKGGRKVTEDDKPSRNRITRDMINDGEYTGVPASEMVAQYGKFAKKPRLKSAVQRGESDYKRQGKKFSYEKHGDYVSTYETSDERNAWVFGVEFARAETQGLNGF